LAGYPNGTFAPNQNIIRIQSLVSLINGNKLDPSGTLDLNGVFGDATAVPSYGQNALIAGTQRCVAVSFDYDSGKLPGGNFNPNQIATRADVAAFVHQVLVASGKLTALDKSSPANKFIASCPQGVYVTKIEAAPVAVTADQAISQLSIPGQVPPVTGSTAVTTLPVGGLSTPNAFGANWGDFFIAASYQDRTRPSVFTNPAFTSPQGGSKSNLGVGLGLGDAKNFLGLEAVANFSDSSTSDLFSRGSADFKVHKLLGDNFAIAGGWERAVDWGDNANTLQNQSTGYGVASVVLNPDPSAGFFSNTTLSVGAGAGRFRSVGDIRTNNDTINVFGSIGTRLSSNFSLVADWNGQDLGVGLPITIPFGDGAAFQVTPALVDLTNSETGGSRFVVGGGLGLRF
jgi:hypothetical protein